MASGQEFGLSRCLSDDEIGSLAEPVRRKLDAFVRDAKGDVEKFRVISVEFKRVTSQLATLTAEKFKAVARVDELTSEDSILRQQLSRLEPEKDSLVKQVGILNTEVSQTRQRLYSTRSEQSHKFIELQAKLDDVAEQLRQTISIKESFQKLIEEKNQKLENARLDVEPEVKSDAGALSEKDRPADV